MPITLSPVQNGIAVLTVDRPQVRNALDWGAMQEFAGVIAAAVDLPDLRCLLLTGAGSTFIAGGDLKALSAYTSMEDGLRLSQGMTAALARLEELPCLTIAALNGPARGGGAEISLACDLRVLADNADLGFVQADMALTPGWGAGQRLLRLAGYSQALEWLATGRVLSAGEAFAHGLANRLAPAGQALEVAMALAAEIAARPPAVTRALKRLLRSGLLLPPETARLYEQAEFPPQWAAEAHQQAVRRFLDRGAGGSDG